MDEISGTIVETPDEIQGAILDSWALLSSFSYSNAEQTVTLGQAIENMVPVLPEGVTAKFYLKSGDLRGLVIDEDTGIISGVPEGFVNAEILCAGYSGTSGIKELSTTINITYIASSEYLGKTLPRDQWNTEGKQLNDEKGNFDGQLKTGIACQMVAANSDWVSFPEISLNDFLISFWVDLDQEANTRFNALGNSTSAQHFIAENITNQIRFRNGGGAVSIADLAGIDGFKNIVITRIGSQITTFVNGSQINTLSVNNSPLLVSSIGNVNGIFNNTRGNCWEIFSASDTFTPSEIYNNPQGFFERSKTSLRSYPLIDNNWTQGTPIHDYSTNKEHGYFNTSFATPSSYNAAIFGIGEGLQLGLVNYHQYAFLYGDGNYYEFTEDLSGATNASIRIVISGFIGSRFIGVSNTIGTGNIAFIAINNTSKSLATGAFINARLYVDKVEFVNEVHTRSDLWSAINDGNTHEIIISGFDASILQGLFFNNFIGGAIWNSEVMFHVIETDLNGDGFHEFSFDGIGMAKGQYNNLALTGGTLLNIAGQDQNGVDILGNALPVHIDGMLSNVNNEGSLVDLGNNSFHSTGESTVALALKIDAEINSNHLILSNRDTGEGIWLYASVGNQLRIFIENSDGTYQHTLVYSSVHTAGWIVVLLCQAVTGELNIFYKTKSESLTRIDGGVFKTWATPETNLTLLNRSFGDTYLNGQVFGLTLFPKDISEKNTNLNEIHSIANSLLSKLP